MRTKAAPATVAVITPSGGQAIWAGSWVWVPKASPTRIRSRAVHIALTWGTVLGIPYAIDGLVPLLAEAYA